MSRLFDADEHGYLTWLHQHPNGYVLTTVRGISLGYLSLHRSTCRMISQYMSNMAPGAFTERKYIKVCADTVSDLRGWINQHGGTGFTKMCRKCNPPMNDGVDETASVLAAFDEKVAHSLADSSQARRDRLARASAVPATVIVTTTIFLRNPDVVAEVLIRAAGRCEGCKLEAPFNRHKDGSPYLEVHHRTRLADWGEDTVENAVALCPNCHRKAHYG